MARIVVYLTRTCGFCYAATALLESRGVAFETVDVTGDPAARRWLVEATARRTVPQIFIDGRPIGGYRELSTLDRSGALAAMTAA